MIVDVRCYINLRWSCSLFGIILSRQTPISMYCKSHCHCLAPFQSCNLLSLVRIIGDSMQFKRMLTYHMSNAKSSVTGFVTMSPVVACEILTFVWIALNPQLSEDWKFDILQLQFTLSEVMFPLKTSSKKMNLDICMYVWLRFSLFLYIVCLLLTPIYSFCQRICCAVWVGEQKAIHLRKALISLGDLDNKCMLYWWKNKKQHTCLIFWYSDEESVFLEEGQIS